MTITIISNDPDCLAPMTFNCGDLAPLDTLEQVLYVFWELIPRGRNWQQELTSVGTTCFEYCGEDPALVRWIGSTTYAVEM